MRSILHGQAGRDALHAGVADGDERCYATGARGATWLRRWRPCPLPWRCAPRYAAQVCLHGLGTNLGVYDDLVPHLLRSGRTVIRYDYFNHGYACSAAETIFFHQAGWIADCAGSHAIRAIY